MDKPKPQKDRLGYDWVYCPECGSKVIVEDGKITIHSRGNNILCPATGEIANYEAMKND